MPLGGGPEEHDLETLTSTLMPPGRERRQLPEGEHPEEQVLRADEGARQEVAGRVAEHDLALEEDLTEAAPTSSTLAPWMPCSSTSRTMRRDVLSSPRRR
jgi:hypothetical protein